jgi:hypothetical protein
MQLRSAEEEARVPAQHPATTGRDDVTEDLGFSVPVSAFAVDIEPIRRLSGGMSDPLGGQAAPPGVAEVLRRRSGHGEPLPEPTRTRMSEQFGTDLTPVRIHNDAESHSVAEAVQSVAFTHGSDIYFSRGSYRPDSPAGQHVLAHELAHVTTAEPAHSGRTMIGRADDPAEAAADATADRVTAQLRRSYRPSPGSAAQPGHGRDATRHGGETPAIQRRAAHRDGSVLRRMSVQGTDWAAATGAKHSSAGAVGVMVVQDGGPPVVVKAGENFLDEAAVAAKVLTAASAGAEEGWTASAPEARPVGAAEAKQIKTKLEAILPADQLKTGRTKGFLSDLDDNKGVMVYGFAAGKELKDALTEESQTKQKGILGKRSVRKDSISYQLMNDPGMMRMFGKVSAADILTANSDRFVGKVNLENVMVDRANKSISLIDNIEAGDGAVLRDMPQYQMTGKRGFDFWSSLLRTVQVAKGDFAAIAKEAIDNLGKAIQNLMLTKEEKSAIRKAYAKRTPQMAAWFTAGLRAGTDGMIKGLGDPVKITASVPDDTREEVMANLIARRLFLGGLSAENAWKVAVAQAKQLMASLQTPKMPPLPPTPPSALKMPPLPPTPLGRPTTQARGRSRAPAFSSR